MLTEVRLGFTAGTSWISRTIRWGDWAEVDGKRVNSLINHALLRFIWDGSQDPSTIGDPDIIYESAGKGVMPSPFSHLRNAMDPSVDKVTRLVEFILPLDEHQRYVVWERAQGMHAAGYDFKALAMYLTWSRILHKKHLKILERDNPDRYTCNQFAAACIGGLLPGIPDCHEDPNQIRLTPEEFIEWACGKPSPVFLKGREHLRHIVEPLAV